VFDGKGERATNLAWIMQAREARTVPRGRKLKEIISSILLKKLFDT
jgi:hypothetical protein